jgi:hypothetical protein
MIEMRMREDEYIRRKGIHGIKRFDNVLCLGARTGIDQARLVRIYEINGSCSSYAEQFDVDQKSAFINLCDIFSVHFYSP